MLRTIRVWAVNQEHNWEIKYMIDVCRRFHKQFPECKFKCYYSKNDPSLYIINIDKLYVNLNSVNEYLHDELITSTWFGDFSFVYGNYKGDELFEFDKNEDIIIYKV